MNRNVVATISHNEYKDVLLNKKCLRYSMNRIQSKDHKIQTYETKKKKKMRRWEKRNRSNVYWAAIKVCVGSTQYGDIKTFSWRVRR